MPKKVFILGAGASIAHSQGTFPGINDFFRTAREKDIAGNFQSIIDYANKFAGVDVLTSEKFNIEDLFTHVEIELVRKTTPENIKLKQDLLEFIRVLLNRLEQNVVLDKGPYVDLRLHIKDSNTTIITLNWDLLLDNILWRRENLDQYFREYPSPQPGNFNNQYANFITQISAISEMLFSRASIGLPYEKWPGKTGFYLKLHGSIDWFYCPTVGCRAYQKVFPLLNYLKTHHCAECHRELENLLVPPVLNKDFEKYHLIQRIWNIASKEISCANELIIYGYSLPPTDFYSSWLLRQVDPENLTRLVIIDKAVSKEDFRMRFTNLLKPRLADTSKENIEWYDSFKGFTVK